MSRLFALAFVVCAFHTVFSQGQGGSTGGPTGADPTCVLKCTAAHREKTMVNAQNVKTNNSTTLCPQMDKNQMEKMDADCAAFKELMNCLGPCADSSMRIDRLTLATLKSQQFICVDRFDDFKKNMPCISNTCPDMERACEPKCGSLEEKSKKVFTLITQIQRNGAPPPAAVGANVSPTPGGKDVDTSAIMKAIADVCTTTDCFMTCGEPTVTKQCGKDAYLFYRDLTLNISSSVAQGVISTVGIQAQWPDECKALMPGGNNTGTTVVVPPSGPGGKVPPTVGNGTTEEPAARGGTAANVIPSIAVIFVTIFLAIGRA